jgi:hypothetical protein
MMDLEDRKEEREKKTEKMQETRGKKREIPPGFTSYI